MSELHDLHDLHDLLVRAAAGLEPRDLEPFDSLHRRARRRRRARGVLAVTSVALIAGGVVGGLAWRGGTDQRNVTPAGTGRDCGTFARGVNSGGVTEAGWQCFTGAMADGTSAQLRLSSLTTEGDPVFQTFSTTGNGQATVLTDARLDAFSGVGNRVQTETCSQPDPRPVAHASMFFLDCTQPEPVADRSGLGSITEVFCSYAGLEHVISAQFTTLGDVRRTNVGGPPPGVMPGKDMFPGRPDEVRAAWCWTDGPAGAGESPGPTWTLYVALATGESERFISTGAGTTPPTGPPSFP
jgi:hypothetical protein